MQRWDIILKGIVRAASMRVNSKSKIGRVMSGGTVLQAEGTSACKGPEVGRSVPAVFCEQGNECG